MTSISQIPNVTTEKRLPLIAIVGPTASGKTSLAIQLAKKFNGEIICADSMTVYHGMDIGTAKPTAAEIDGVPHHLLDIVEPNEQFSLYDFQRIAKKAISDIRVRGHIPFLVGGSGLYIDSILFDYQLGDTPDGEHRAKLQEMNNDDLMELLKKQHIEVPNNLHNKRHLIRAIEQNGINRIRCDRIVDNTYAVGITTDKSELYERSRARAQQMLANGFVEEVRDLYDKYGYINQFRGNAYGEVVRYLQGDIDTEEELLERIAAFDKRLIKKQLTWLKRNAEIVWLARDEVEKYLCEKLKQLT